MNHRERRILTLADDGYDAVAIACLLMMTLQKVEAVLATRPAPETVPPAEAVPVSVVGPAVPVEGVAAAETMPQPEPARTEWTEERKRQLVALWDEGSLSSLDLAERFGVSKGAILGMLHRLGARPRHPGRTRKGVGATAPAAVERTSALAVPAVAPAPEERPWPAPVAVEEDETEAEDDSEDTAPRAAIAGPEGCKWPMWPHADRPNHVYCNKAPAAFGVPYCAGHMAMAYVPLPRRRRSLDGLADYVTGQWAKRRQA